MKPTQLKALMKLMTAHRIESLKVSPDGTIEIVKKIHLYEPPAKAAPDDDAPSAQGETVEDPDEDVMFYSSRAPKLSLRDIEARSANKPEPPKVQ